VTGLPPLPGFIAKFALLSTAFQSARDSGIEGPVWAFCIAVVATGFAGVIALTRMGTRLFWTSIGRRTPRLHVFEAAPVAFLMLLCLLLSAASGPVMGFLEATAQSLHEPSTYIRTVLDAK